MIIFFADFADFAALGDKKIFALFVNFRLRVSIKLELARILKAAEFQHSERKFT